MSDTTITDNSGSESVEALARQHPALVQVARVGWVAKGIVYALVGVLAVPIAVQGLTDDRASGRAEASQTGAVAEIADTSFGTVALWTVAIGLSLYVVWRLISIVLPAENTAKVWLTRGGYLISALVYGALAWSAASLASAGTSRGAGSEDARVERFTRELMEKSAGRWLVGAIGVVFVCVGIYFLYKGLKATFRDELESGGVGPFSHDAIVMLGRIGWAGRGTLMALVGWFLVQAAVHFKPKEAHGFDGALRDATSSTPGALLVAFAAVALFAYGLFCVISAPRQRLVGAD